MTTRNIPNRLKSLFGALFAVLVMSGTAHGWWNSDWTIRKKITIDTSDKGAAITEPVGTTPVLIRLHDDELQFAAAKDDGTDLRFVAADDKTPLLFHIEHYDSTMSEADIWVQVPDVKPGAQTTIWLYYGNPKAERADDSKKTYDKDTSLVYHFSEKGAPAGDSTANANNAQNPGVARDGSMIGTGVVFDGKATITIPFSDSLKWIDGQPLTWSAWFKPNVLQPNAVIFSRRDGANSFIVGVDKGVPYAEINGQRTNAGSPGAAGTWYNLAVVSDGSALTVYLDGAVYGAASKLPPLSAMNSPMTIGGDTQAGATNFNGELDELEISKVARSAGFIKLAAISQGPDGATKVIGLGQDEQQSNWMSAFNNGTMGVLIHSLTPDGWAVIAILSLMAIISRGVMISKASYLNKITKGNDHFMREWRHVAADLTILDDPDSDIRSMGGRVEGKKQRLIRNASVYRIYHIGAEEIRHRFSGDINGAKVLSAQSIQAIRASLDAGMVKESHKLNNLMVLLTIAISGGPFLGLLGTVIGVMITFAAIAAAGDVNVNAIAPGIAAALLATVAGLTVAIPSLFGYNYLTIRIKNATSDMHVFIDEFVTKMAEFYRPRPEPAMRPIMPPREFAIIKEKD